MARAFLRTKSNPRFLEEARMSQDHLRHLVQYFVLWAQVLPRMVRLEMGCKMEQQSTELPRGPSGALSFTFRLSLAPRWGNSPRTNFAPHDEDGTLVPFETVSGYIGFGADYGREMST